MISVRPDTIMQNVYDLFSGLAMQAGIKLDIFSQLDGKPSNAETLAEALHVSENKLSPLLYALVTAGLLTLNQGVFSNTEETQTYLVQGNARYCEHVCYLIDKIWKVVSKTADTIVQGKAQSKLDWAKSEGHDRLKFFYGQYAGCLQAGRELCEMIDLTDSRHILDIAGGSGGLAVGMRETCPNAEITVVDLPEVVPFTRRLIAEAGPANRILIQAADLIRQSPKGRYDMAILRSFIQVLSPEHAQCVLRNIQLAIEPGGTLIIIGRFLTDSRLFPRDSVAHNLLFLNLYENGRAYTESQYGRWLEKAGFIDVRFRYDVFSDGAGMITAVKSRRS